MAKTYLDNLVQETIKKTKFVLRRKVHQSYYYTPDKVRSLVFEGVYQNKPAVLKVYNNPYPIDEPIALNSFNRVNKSKILKAPEVYADEIISPRTGWLIMEKLPGSGQFFKSPLKPNQRKQFINLYLEYRRTFPSKPTRKLTLSENLSADEFHIYRINRWFQLANDKELEIAAIGEKPILKPEEFIPRFKKGINLIRREFKNRKMIWCQGHFKPNQVFQAPGNVYYLTDFGHTKMYPEGYELGLIIWADWMMVSNENLPYNKWKEGINDWLDKFRVVASKLRIKKFQSLMKASLVERSLGTILADICATNQPRKKKTKRISLIYQLLDEIMEQ